MQCAQSLSDQVRDVRFGSKAEMCVAPANVRYRPKADMCSANGHERADNRIRGEWFHSNLAGTENGLVASTTNIISAANSVVPPLKTSIVVPAGCPFIAWPASTFITPSGVRWLNLPATT